jgi:multimeric flavodoxin WrbA
MMKVVAFNGSARKDGNTAILLGLVLDELKGEGIETEMIQLAGETLSGCIACYKCAEKKNQKCVVTKDRPLRFYLLPPTSSRAKRDAPRIMP